MIQRCVLAACLLASAVNSGECIAQTPPSQPAPSTAVAASVKPSTRAQQLVDDALAKHPAVTILVMRVKPPGSSLYVICGSNIGRYGSPAGKDDTRVISSGETSYEEDLVKGIYEVEPAMRDRDGHILGSLSVVFHYREGQDKAPLIKTANEILATMSAQVPQNQDLFAPSSASTYGQHLATLALAQYPNLLELKLNSIDDSEIISTANSVSPPQHRVAIERPLLDTVGNTIGTLSTTFSSSDGADSSALESEATAIRDQLRRRIIEHTNLADPYPYDPSFAGNTYGQHLVEDALLRDHDILVLGIHAQPPASSDSVILASSFGRIGKKDDAGDLSAVVTGKPNLAINKAGNRYSIGLPLRNVVGKTIGLLTIAFAYTPGKDTLPLLARAEKVRDQLSRRILDISSLVEPYPYDPALSAHIVAQDLVEETLLLHPHLIGIAMHVTPPGSSDNVIVASSFGRVGKKSDESDLRLIASGKHNMAVWPSGDRYSGELMLHDAAGNTIGSLLEVFPYKSGEDTAILLHEATEIRDELAKNIPALTQLFAHVN